MARDNCDPSLTGLFSGDAYFLQGVVSYDGFPETDLWEICFAGRSNVGKSSLINAITGCKGLARTSNTPGRTQEINYFSLADKILITDLPGYGFAQAPKQKVETWTRLIEDYLIGRSRLRRAFILIDSRHGIKKIDREIFEKMDKSGVSYQLVFTKADKIHEKTLKAMKEEAEKIILNHVAAHPRIIATSSETGAGLNDVRREIAAFLPEYAHILAELDAPPA